MKAAGNPDVSTVSCPCGANIEVDLASGDDVIFCPECRETLQLSVSIDPVTKKKRVGVVLSMGALLSKKGRKGETHVPGASGEVHKAKCTCGSLIFVDPQKADSIHTCGKCGAGFSAVLKRGSTPGLSTLVLRPVQATPVTKVAPAPKPSPRPAVPAKPTPPAAAGAPGVKPAAAPKAPSPAPKAPVQAAPAAPTRPRPSPPVGPAKAALPPKAAPRVFDAAATPAREQVMMIHKGDMGAQAIHVREEGSFIACFCGKEIRLKGEANREMHKCADCGSAYRLFYAFDPRSKAPMVVMLPRPAGK